MLSSFKMQLTCIKLNLKKFFLGPRGNGARKTGPIRQLIMPQWTFGEERYKYTEMEFLRQN